MEQPIIKRHTVETTTLESNCHIKLEGHEVPIPSCSETPRTEPIRISVIATIGGGKSYAMEQLAAKHPETIEIICENVDKWTNLELSNPETGEIGHVNMLAHFYSKPKQYASLLQFLTLLTLVNDSQNPQKKPVRLIERCIDANRIFAELNHQLGNIDDAGLAIYQLFLKLLAPSDKSHPLWIDAYVYLYTPVIVAHNRCTKRKRDEESKMNTAYLAALQQKTQEFFCTRSRGCIEFDKTTGICMDVARDGKPTIIVDMRCDNQDTVYSDRIRAIYDTILKQ